MPETPKTVAVAITQTMSDIYTAPTAASGGKGAQFPRPVFSNVDGTNDVLIAMEFVPPGGVAVPFGNNLVVKAADVASPLGGPIILEAGWTMRAQASANGDATFFMSGWELS